MKLDEMGLSIEFLKNMADLDNIDVSEINTILKGLFKNIFGSIVFCDNDNTLQRIIPNVENDASFKKSYEEKYKTLMEYKSNEEDLLSFIISPNLEDIFSKANIYKKCSIKERHTRYSFIFSRNTSFLDSRTNAGLPIIEFSREQAIIVLYNLKLMEYFIEKSSSLINYFKRKFLLFLIIVFFKEIKNYESTSDTSIRENNKLFNLGECQEYIKEIVYLYMKSLDNVSLTKEDVDTAIKSSSDYKEFLTHLTEAAKVKSEMKLSKIKDN